MDKNALLKQCAELGMKNVTKLKKSELLQKLNDFQIKKPLPNYLLELHEKIPKDIIRKVCKQCGKLGHGIASMECSTNITNKDVLKQKVKDYFLSQDGSDDTMHFEFASKQLGISLNQCKEMYSEIPWIDLLNRKNSISSIVDKITFTKCVECHKNKCTIQSNPFRKWKEKNICDQCFTATSAEREKMWKLISNYKPIQCTFCNDRKDHKDERFHFDHINMFDKEESICTMVLEGVEIEKIYEEIDKCQVLCFSCHQIITHMENAMGFTRQKKSLTRQLNQNALSKEDHANQIQNYQKIYDEIMIPIYKTIKEKYL